MIIINSKNFFKGPLLLLIAALIWGISFVAQSIGMEKIETFTFNGMRTTLGCIALIPVIFFFDRSKKKSNSDTPVTEDKKLLWKGGIFCGLALFFGSNLQQYAFKYSTVGKVGFITALYMILVPIFGIFLKKKVRKVVWFSVVLAAFGLYLLCISDSFSLSKGDIVTLLGAVCFAIHILVIDRYSPLVDGVKMSCIQFLVSGSLSLICMLLFEHPDLHAIWSVAPAIAYAGIMSCSVAFTFQIIGQKYTEPAIASMLLCLESVFAVIAGWLILKQTLSPREICGCIIMFTAIILTQIPGKKTAKS